MRAISRAPRLSAHGIDHCVEIGGFSCKASASDVNSGCGWASPDAVSHQRAQNAGQRGQGERGRALPPSTSAGARAFRPSTHSRTSSGPSSWCASASSA